MHINERIFLVAILLTSYIRVSAQDSTASRSLFVEGLTFQGGIGYIAVRDEYISGERYSAALPLYAVTWSKYHETYDFRLHLEYQHTHNLKEFDLSAELSQFRLVLDYLYPISEATIFSRTLCISLGPTAEIFEYYRRQILAGSQSLHSSVALVSGGLRSDAVMPLAASLQARATVQLTLISMSFHSVNSNGSDESPTRLLTPFSAIDANGAIVFTYCLAPSFYGSAGYRFDVTRISAWDYFLSASDNLIFSLTYGF
jgi:hypothetical protein